MGDQGPFDFFRQETSNPDVFVRSEAMGKVLVILALMGPERARADMVPYLLAKVGLGHEPDEILLALSNCLGEFTKYIGGPDHIGTLVPLLELLCNVEEVCVRNAVVSSIHQILASLPHGTQPSISTAQRALSGMLMEMFKRLAFEDTTSDVFYSRSSAASIAPDVYRVLTESDRPALRQSFLDLSTKDEVALVKRAAAQTFNKMLDIVEPDIVPTEYLGILKSAFNDEVSTVRIMAAENISTYCEVLSNLSKNTSERISPAAQAAAKALLDTAGSDLIQLIKSSYTSTSWRIRQAMAKSYGRLVACFSDASIIRGELFPGVVVMIQDPEPEVRGTALESVASFLGPVDATYFLSEFIPVANELKKDPASAVRKTLAEVVVDIAARLPPELVAQNISDTIIQMLAQDEDPLVRIRIVRKLPKIAEEVPSLCTRLTDYIKACLKDSNWRLRKEVILVLPFVTKHMSTEYFTDQFLQLYIEKLKDNVDEVRLAYALSLGNLYEAVGPDYILEKLYFPIRGMNTENNLVKISMIRIIQGMFTKMGEKGEVKIKAEFLTNFLTIVINCAGFKVPNVRMAVAQCLGAAARAVGAEVSRALIRPVLAELVQDKDRDVIYFAAISLKNCPT